MLLFTLLSTLLFGSPGTPAKDTLPVVKPRPSIGVFYMTGPRAYGSNGFLGVQGSMPVATSYQVSLGVGGDFHKQLDKNPAIIIPQPTDWGGNTRVLQTLRITRSYLLEFAFERSIPVSRKLDLLGGLSIGYAQIYSSYEYDGIPTLVPNDTSSVNGMWLYSHQRSKYRDIQFWTGPQLSLQYRLSKRFRFLIGGVFGYKNHIVSESFSNLTYVLSPDYGLSPRRIYEPFNFEGVNSRLFQKGEGFSLEGTLPTNNKTTSLTGFSSFFVSLNFFL